MAGHPKWRRNEAPRELRRILRHVVVALGSRHRYEAGMYTIRLRAGPSRMATAYTAKAALEKAERWEADGLVVVTCANGETYPMDKFRTLVLSGVDLDPKAD
jgi:hypothetical protein